MVTGTWRDVKARNKQDAWLARSGWGRGEGERSSRGERARRAGQCVRLDLQSFSGWLPHERGFMTLRVTLVHESPGEAAVRDLLQDLAGRDPLERYTFTEEIHSKPVRCRTATPSSP